MWVVVAFVKCYVICRVPYIALPIATCISLQNNVPMVMQWIDVKDYHTKKGHQGGF
jgi:uridine monophosphate synthetase